MISSLAPVVSNVESWGISQRTALRTRNRPQIPRLFFSGMVCNGSCDVHPRNDFCADHSRDNSRSGVYRNDSRTRDTRNESRANDDSRNERSANVDSRNGLCVEDDFQRDGETFLGVRKDDVTFPDVQTDGVNLPVPGSSSSFSLASVVVVGPRENQCRDVKLESGGEAEHHMSEPFVNSPETKRLMEIAIASGASVRTACKTVRKRLRIEARRPKELDGGVEPEVVLDSFLNQVKVEHHRQSCQTSSCEGQEVLRETLCWWIANDKVCPDGDRCNFRHAVAEEKEQTVSGTGA